MFSGQRGLVTLTNMVFLAATIGFSTNGGFAIGHDVDGIVLAQGCCREETKVLHDPDWKQKIRRIAARKQDLMSNIKSFTAREAGLVFSDYPFLFDLFCPGVSVICLMLPILQKDVATLMLNYLIDRTNINPGFYFDKGILDVSLLDITQILADFGLYKKTITSAGLGKEIYLRFVALEADFLFLRAYSFLFKTQKMYSDFTNISNAITAIDCCVQSLFRTKYEKKYVKKLRLLKEVLAFAQNEHISKKKLSFDV